ncbi:unannotated protein [freshwater metagenome]|uniref:Unannotated protein n=1 Tax=freshwater metagenome TaxID=449393 RepID=A0A6J7CH98_9ZZZZ
MALTPEDVRNKQFTTVRLREGYDEDEVDAFLDEIETELARLLRENEELRQRASQVAPAANVSEPVPPVAPTPEMEVVRSPEPVPVPAAVVAVPAAAVVSESPSAAADSAARVLELAQRTADDLVNQARAEADRIVGEAHLKAENSERDAQVQRAALEARVEDLRNFEREYRTRMRGYFENQLRELETRGGADPSSALESSAPAAIANPAQPVAVPVAAPALVGPGATPAQPAAAAPEAVPVPIPVPTPAPTSAAAPAAPPQGAPQPPPVGYNFPPVSTPSAPAEAGPFSPPPSTPIPSPEQG